MIPRVSIIFLLVGCTVASQEFPTMSSNQAQRATPSTLKNRQFSIQNPARIAQDTQESAILNPFYEFNRKLFDVLGPALSRSNMVYSPLSLQTLLGFIYTGTEGRTAKELHAALAIPELPGEVARQFQTLLQHIELQTSPDMQLNMANIFYYNDYLSINEDFYRRSIPYFGAIAEATDFTAPQRAARHINNMVANITRQRIKNLIRAGTLNADTQAILVNAIYLKAKWATEFSASDTQTEEFHITKLHTMPVAMMYSEDYYSVGEIPDLNARAINLPFQNSNLSMLIILPNEIDGLENLERMLESTGFSNLTDSLRNDHIILRMPKFQFDFEIDMTAPLMKLGAARIFSDYAELDGFFNDQNVRIEKIQHKAYINVNEGGVEAAAASFGKLQPLSVPVNMNYFTIDHPFVFIIRSPEAVYFIGHVVKP